MILKVEEWRECTIDFMCLDKVDFMFQMDKEFM